MMNVLLVDDEPGALQAMKHLVNWEEFGYTIKGEANNAAQALEMLAHFHYSLVITDIFMPVINGLELIAALRQVTSVPVVVVSGYEEFGYARECVKLGVKDYLLKPVTQEDLVKVITSVKNEQVNEHRREKQLQLGIPAMREQLLKSWVRGYLKENEIIEQFGFINIELDKYCKFGCMIIEVEYPDLTDAYWTESEIRVAWFAVRNIIEEVLHHRGLLFEESSERYGIVLFGESETFGEEELLAMAQSIHKFTAKFAKVPVTIGVSNIFNSMDCIMEAYHFTENVLNRKFMVGGPSILSYDSLTVTCAKYEDNEPQWIPSILEAVNQCDPSAVHSLLFKQMNELIDMQVSKERIQSLIIELFVHLFQFLQEKAREEDRLFEEGIRDYQSIMEYKTIEKLFEFTEQKCLNIIEYTSKSPSSPPLRTVQQVKKMINEAYGSNLSLKSIAEQLYITPSYLGRIFKLYEGISFNDYLMGYRMEQAKRLLETTEKKVYEIALQVGYRQLDWFYKKFKDHTGKSPSDFRVVNYASRGLE
ncbi:response regulator transcription factor [Paenibacillus dokdonensis]|uniref:response regulator transcription factor n=1 Tax=Paenibacillus dokdonensis TaxID=2567944 RepID=UPI0010A80872|nr:response regulator [Paenibacillus dokdonensis]